MSTALIRFVKKVNKNYDKNVSFGLRTLLRLCVLVSIYMWYVYRVDHQIPTLKDLHVLFLDLGSKTKAF